MSIPDVMERSKLSEGGVYQLIRDGTLKAVKIRRRTVVRSSDFETWVDSLNEVRS
jgi:excisionase family DNA binding protein